MGAPATFPQTFGLDTVDVVFSSLSASPTVGTVRDGKSDVVTAVANGSTGVYTFTLAKAFPQMIAGFACITPADATPTDIVCDVSYNSSTGVITVYTRAAAVLTAPESGSRINVFCRFSRSSSLKDA
jgi:hypothetical protein